MGENWVQLHSENQYENAAKLLETSNEEKVAKLWKQKVHDERTIPSNKWDKIIREN
jgi:hypothetical protein